MYNYTRVSITTTCDTREEVEHLYDKVISQGYNAYISINYKGKYILTQYR